MNTEKFNEIVEGCKAHINSVLASKATEYARGDRLSNFKSSGRRLNCTPEKALMFFREKHEVSILNIVNDLDSGDLPTHALLSEKIGDSINYLILLKALIVERLEIAGEVPHP